MLPVMCRVRVAAAAAVAAVEISAYARCVGVWKYALLLIQWLGCMAVRMSDFCCSAER